MCDVRYLMYSSIDGDDHGCVHPGWRKGVDVREREGHLLGCAEEQLDVSAQPGVLHRFRSLVSLLPSPIKRTTPSVRACVRACAGF